MCEVSSEYTDWGTPLTFDVPRYTKIPSTGLFTCGLVDVITPSPLSCGVGAKNPSMPTSCLASVGPTSL